LVYQAPDCRKPLAPIPVTERVGAGGVAPNERSPNMSPDEQTKRIDALLVAIRVVDTKLNMLLVKQNILSEKELHELHAKVYRETMRELQG